MSPSSTASSSEASQSAPLAVYVAPPYRIVLGLRALVDPAEATGGLNVAFVARFLLGDLTECACCHHTYQSYRIIIAPASHTVSYIMRNLK